MSAPTAVLESDQSLGEEIANSVSHGVGFVAAMAATPLLLSHAAQRGGGGFLVGTSVFGAALMLLYLASTLYHALPRGKAKRVFQIVDHAAIFFLIAGTYTPFTLGVLRGAWGWTLFALVWAFAVIGVILKAVCGFGRGIDTVAPAAAPGGRAPPLPGVVPGRYQPPSGAKSCGGRPSDGTLRVPVKFFGMRGEPPSARPGRAGANQRIAANKSHLPKLLVHGVTVKRGYHAAASASLGYGSTE